MTVPGTAQRSLAGKTLFITGASRGIGKAIALRAAQDGANVVIAARTAKPHPKLPGTIDSAAAEIEAAGGKALPCLVNVRFEKMIRDAIKRAMAAFGSIDILVNNASAIQLTQTLETPLRRFDLVHNVNVRATFLCSQLCLPYLQSSCNPHILILAPPINFDPYWFAKHLPYTMSKYGMSMCTLGLSHEFAGAGVAVNALWPRTGIATSAVANLLGGDRVMRRCRKPEIVADAAYAIVTRPARSCTGNFFIDDEVLASEGVRDFSPYAVDPSVEDLEPDFFF